MDGPGRAGFKSPMRPLGWEALRKRYDERLQTRTAGSQLRPRPAAAAKLSAQLLARFGGSRRAMARSW